MATILVAVLTRDVSPTLERARTPFENGPLRSVSPAYALLTQAADSLPNGASVVPITEPRNAVAETNFYRAAVGLMPKQRILPAARWGTPTPEHERKAEYVLVLGRETIVPEAEIFLRFPDGTLWRRTSR